MHAASFRVHKIWVWDSDLFHGPAAAECDGVIQTVVQSLVGPLLSKKYVDCEILMGKEENSNSAVKDISQLHGLKLGKGITSKQRPNALLTMKTQFFLC